MFSHIINRSLKKHWPLILFFIIAFPLLVGLGQWQLSRAHEKEALLSEYENLNATSLVAIESLSPEEVLPYRQVRLQGYYEPERYWLLDNRSRNGQVGYEVLMPFANQNRTILVNRGWLPAAKDRHQLPDLKTPEGEQVISGYLFGAETNAWIKHSESDLALSWPKRVLHLDAEQASHYLDKDLYPLILRLHGGASGALVTNWQITNSQPSKHYGYAFQWFSMALALLVLFIWALCRQTN